MVGVGRTAAGVAERKKVLPAEDAKSIPGADDGMPAIGDDLSQSKSRQRKGGRER